MPPEMAPVVALKFSIRSRGVRGALQSVCVANVSHVKCVLPQLGHWVGSHRVPHHEHLATPWHAAGAGCASCGDGEFRATASTGLIFRSMST